MSFTLLTQLEEVLLNFIVTSPSSYAELEILITDLYLDYREVSQGHLSNVLTKMAKKGLITKEKNTHIDSNGKHCYCVYKPTSLGTELLDNYNNLHQTLKYSLAQYSKIKHEHNPKYVKR